MNIVSSTEAIFQTTYNCYSPVPHNFKITDTLMKLNSLRDMIAKLKTDTWDTTFNFWNTCAGNMAHQFLTGI